MSQLASNKKEFIPENIDKEFEALTLKLSTGIENLLVFEADIYYFISENFGFCKQLLQTLDLKGCFFLYRKNEKILMMIFKFLQLYDKPKFPTKAIYFGLMDAPKDVNSLDFNLIINQSNEKPLKDAVIHEDKTVSFFFEKSIRFLIFSVNNSSVILIKREKVLSAWQNLIRVLFVRLKVLNSLLAMFHIGIMEINIAYSLYLLEKYEFANIFINRGLKNIEFLHKLEKNTPQTEDFVERKSDLLCILE